MARIAEHTEYRFAELSEEAQQHAIQTYFSDYDWGGEALDSLKACVDYFNATLKDYTVDYSNANRSSASFRYNESQDDRDCPDCCLDDENCETCGGQGLPSSLETLIQGIEPLKARGCVWTGYCMDDTLIEGAIEAWNDGEKTTEAILQGAFSALAKAVADDYEYQTSVEAITENCKANDYWFHGNGTMA